MNDSQGTTLAVGDSVKFYPVTKVWKCPECGDTAKFGAEPSEVVCTKKGNHKSHKSVEMVRVFRMGTVHGSEGLGANNAEVLVHLEGDPFPVPVDPEFITKVGKADRKGAMKMATTATARPGSVKELRAKAKKIGVEGWEQMSIAELEAAVSDSSPAPKVAGSKPKAPKAEKAPKAPKAKKEEESTEVLAEPIDINSKKKGKAKKAAAPKSEPKKADKPAKKSTAKKSPATKRTSKVEGPNPYREGTLRHKIAEELIKGGTLAELRKRIGKGLQITNRDGELLEGDALKAELSHRIMATSYDIRNLTGATRKKEGRGDEAFWQIIPK